MMPRASRSTMMQSLGDREDALQLVRDDDGRHAEAVVQRQDQLVELDRAHRIEPGRRLVEEEQRRIEGQRARDAGALLHAARDLRRQVVLEALEADEAELRAHDRVDRGGVEVRPGAERLGTIAPDRDRQAGAGQAATRLGEGLHRECPRARAAFAPRLRLLVGELLATDLPASLRELLVDRSEGNPFFVEELLATLIDRGVLGAENGGWTVTLSCPEDFDVPDTVQAVLAARIDLLDAAEKEALPDGSVIGRVFWTSPVYELLEEESRLRAA